MLTSLKEYLSFHKIIPIYANFSQEKIYKILIKKKLNFSKVHWNRVIPSTILTLQAFAKKLLKQAKVECSKESKRVFGLAKILTQNLVFIT